MAHTDMVYTMKSSTTLYFDSETEYLDSLTYITHALDAQVDGPAMAVAEDIPSLLISTHMQYGRETTVDVYGNGPLQLPDPDELDTLRKSVNTPLVDQALLRTPIAPETVIKHSPSQTKRNVTVSDSELAGHLLEKDIKNRVRSASN